MLRDQIVIIVRLHRPGPALGTGTRPSAMISAQIAISNIIIICPSVSGGVAACRSCLCTGCRIVSPSSGSGYNPVHHKSVINHFTAPACAGLVLASSAASVLLLLARLCRQSPVRGETRPVHDFKLRHSDHRHQQPLHCCCSAVHILQSKSRSK